MSDHFRSNRHLNPHAYQLHWCQAFSVSNNNSKLIVKTGYMIRHQTKYLKLVRVHGMQTGKNRWTDSTLQKMNCHQHQRITGNGHILGVVNIMKLSPQFNDQR